MCTHGRQVRASSKEANIGTALRKACAKVAAQTSRTDHCYAHGGSQELTQSRQGNGQVSDRIETLLLRRSGPLLFTKTGQLQLIRAQFQSEKRIVQITPISITDYSQT